MEKAFKYCQSCGMPLKKDEKCGGTNADGSESTKYCSRCFQKGLFTRPDINAKQIQQLVKDKMKEMGMPGFIASLFSHKIPNLDRWKNK